MTLLSQDAATRLINAAANGAPCAFIDNFISDKNDNTLFYRGMIFGAGEVILEYFAGAVFWHDIKFKAFTPDPNKSHAFQQFQEYCNHHKGFGGDFVPARSNSYISFTKHLKITHTNENQHPEHSLSLTFDPAPPKHGQSSASQQQRGFFDKFKNSHLTPDKTPIEKLIKGITKDASKSGPTPPQIYNIGNLISIRQFMTRRACKFLLYEVILDQNGIIHYALDELNGDIIIDKKAIPLAGREELGNKVPVCTSEIRELFRMWNFFNAHTFFYRNFDITAPLWETCSQENLEKWATYAFHILTKEANITMENENTQFEQLGEALANFIIAYTNKNYKQAIACYHAIDYRLLPQSALKHPSLVPPPFIKKSRSIDHSSMEEEIFPTDQALKELK